MKYDAIRPKWGYYFLFLVLLNLITTTCAQAGPLVKRITDEQLVTKMTSSINRQCSGNSTCENEVIAALMENHVANGQQCGFPEATKQNWRDLNVDQFQTEQLAAWREMQQKDVGLVGKNFFTEFFVPKFFGNTAPSQVACDGLGDCYVSCGDQSTNTDVDTATLHKAWLMAVNTGNFYRAGMGVTEGVKQTFQTMALDTDKLSSDFTSLDEDTKAFNYYKMQARLAQEMTQAVVLGIVLMASSFFDQAGALFGGAYAGINGVVSSGLNNHWAGKTADDWLPSFQANFGAELAEAFKETMGVLTYVPTSIIADLDGPLRQEYSLDRVLAGGNFLEIKQVDIQAMAKKSMTYLSAFAVDYAWGASQSYIVASNAQGTCESDSRGPFWSKVCDPLHPELVMYAYAIPRGWNSVPLSEGQVTVPPGMLEFMDRRKNQTYNDITLDAAVISSMNYYRSFGNARPAPPLNVTFQRSLDGNVMGYSGSSESRGIPNGRLPNGDLDLNGFFKIPVCMSPGGEHISSILSDEGRNYPCQCGFNDPRHNMAKGGGEYEEYKDESAQFLAATGLMYSDDLESYCSVNMGCTHEHANYQRFSNQISGWDGNFDIPYTKCEDFKEHSTMGKLDGEKYSAYG